MEVAAAEEEVVTVANLGVSVAAVVVVMVVQISYIAIYGILSCY
jgi:hypothetical protein